MERHLAVFLGILLLSRGTYAQLGQKSLIEAAFSSQIIEEAPEATDAGLKRAYDGARAALPAVRGSYTPSRRRPKTPPKITAVQETLAEDAKNLPAPGPAATPAGPDWPVWTGAALSEAVAPFRAALDLAWEGAWTGWTRLAYARASST